MDNFVPLVAPRLSSSSSSSSASTSRPKDQSTSSGEFEASTDLMTTRRAKNACWKPMLTDLDKQATGNREPEDLETHVPAHPSEREISDSEGDASKVETQKRKHSIETHFAEDRNWDICLRTKVTRVPCRRRNEGSIPRAEKFGDLITADHKVLNEGSESRNNHLYAVVV